MGRLRICTIARCVRWRHWQQTRTTGYFVQTHGHTDVGLASQMALLRPTRRFIDAHRRVQRRHAHSGQPLARLHSSRGRSMRPTVLLGVDRRVGKYHLSNTMSWPVSAPCVGARIDTCCWIDHVASSTVDHSCQTICMCCFSSLFWVFILNNMII